MVECFDLCRCQYGVCREVLQCSRVTRGDQSVDRFGSEVFILSDDGGEIFAVRQLLDVDGLILPECLKIGQFGKECRREAAVFG
ncbi:hypothetical protein D1872_335630 [compost metagenome]